MTATDGHLGLPGYTPWSGAEKRRPRHGVSVRPRESNVRRSALRWSPLRVSERGAVARPLDRTRPGTFFIGSAGLLGDNNGRPESRERVWPGRCRLGRGSPSRVLDDRLDLNGARPRRDEACSPRGGNPRVPDRARWRSLRSVGVQRRILPESRSRTRERMNEIIDRYWRPFVRFFFSFAVHIYYRRINNQANNRTICTYI